MLERYFLTCIQFVCLQVFNLVLFALAGFACFTLVSQLFEDVYSLGSISVYEALFIVLLNIVLRRSWRLHCIAGLNLGNYIYKIAVNLAYWISLVIAVKIFTKNHEQPFLESLNGGLVLLGSFLLAIYATAAFRENSSMPERVEPKPGNEIDIDNTKSPSQNSNPTSTSNEPSK